MAKLSDNWIRQRRAELASKSSDAEKAAYHNILRLGYSVVRQYPVWTKRKIYFADLYIPKLKIIMEIDGGYHYTSKQKRLDSNRSSGLRRLGYHVVRLNNHDAHNINKIKYKIFLILRHNY